MIGWLQGWYHAQPIRKKLFATYATVVTFLLLLGGVATDQLVRHSLEQGIETALSNSTTSILNLLETALSGSIHNYLRGIADQDLNVVVNLHDRTQRGEITHAEARSRAIETLLSQRIGKTGYVCVLDSSGTMRVHPNGEMIDQDLSEYAFVQEITTRREGYLEYVWQNPGENATRPKAMFMAYFEPWDWIILATSYRDEFHELVQLDDLKQSILSLRLGPSGYSYILDLEGNIILHPHLEGRNVSQLADQPTEFIDEMIRQRSGKIRYFWRNPEEDEPREKIVLFKTLPAFGWIVASASYVDEVYAPLHRVRTLFLVFIGGALIVLLLLTYAISSTITRPLERLIARVAPAPDDPGPAPGDEVQRLTECFDAYVARLQAETAERRQLEREVIGAGDRERARVGQELHDDLAPHLVGVAALAKLVAEHLPEDSREAASMTKIRTWITEASTKIRALSRGLCTVHLAGDELELSLREMAADVTSLHGLPCEVTVQGELPLLDDITVAQLAFIAREALHNAVKHAHASRLAVAAEPVGAGVRLVISDDGVGFDPTRSAVGMGLRIQRYRASTIGAELVVESRPGGGTCVTVVSHPGEKAP